jgi:hypothetical protein
MTDLFRHATVALTMIALFPLGSASAAVAPDLMARQKAFERRVSGLFEDAEITAQDLRSAASPDQFRDIIQKLVALIGQIREARREGEEIRGELDTGQADALEKSNLRLRELAGQVRDWHLKAEREALIFAAESPRSEACRARDAAEASRSVDDSKTAASRAEDAARRTRSVADKTAIADVQKIAAHAEKCAQAARSIAASKERLAGSLCGLRDDGTPRTTCGVAGVFGATLSQMFWTSPMGAYGGSSTQRLASVAVPFAAWRWAPLFEREPLEAEDPERLYGGYVAFEIGAYSAFLTKALAAADPDPTLSSCSRDGGDFERRLPCQANAAIYPYLGTYAAMTAGRSGVGYITISPVTLGLAQVGAEKGLRWFAGWMMGIFQINGAF